MIDRSQWNPAGIITSARTVLGPTQRNATFVSAISNSEKAEMEVMNDQGDTLEIRFSGDGANNSQNTVELYASRTGADHYSHIATVVIIQGAQLKSTGVYFTDTLEVTMHDTSFLCAPVQQKNNQIGRLLLDTNGYRHFLIIATALTSTNLIVEAASIVGQVHSVLPPRSLVTASDEGGPEVLTISTSTADEGSDQICRSSIIWTDGNDMRFKLGTTAAVATDPQLIPNQYLPMPVCNTNLLRFFNAGTEASVFIIWRN